MDSPLLIAAGASFIAGLLGYIIARLWIKPIVRYNVTKRKLDHELVQYLALMKATVEPDKKLKKQNRGEAMLKTARKHAMDLVSCYGADIPYCTASCWTVAKSHPPKRRDCSPTSLK